MRFAPLGEKRTEVELVQSNWEAFGDMAEMLSPVPPPAPANCADAGVAGSHHAADSGTSTTAARRRTVFPAEAIMTPSRTPVSELRSVESRRPMPSLAPLRRSIQSAGARQRIAGLHSKTPARPARRTLVSGENKPQAPTSSRGMGGSSCLPRRYCVSPHRGFAAGGAGCVFLSRLTPAQVSPGSQPGDHLFR